MNQVTAGIGIFAILCGLYNLYLDFFARDGSAPLAATQRAFGPQLGILLQVIAFTLVPLFFGVATLVRGLRGEAFF